MIKIDQYFTLIWGDDGEGGYPGFSFGSEQIITAPGTYEVFIGGGNIGFGAADIYLAGEDEEAGMEFSIEMDVSYELSEDRWPLRVGKEVEVIETNTTSMEFGGEDMIETDTTTSIYKVEAIEDITVEDIENDEPLFREGLGLDSIDALELVVAIEKIFNIIIEDEDVGKKAFASINALAKFIQDGY